MQTINLKQYYPFCTEDTFVEVSDEIVEAFLLDKRAEAARERKMYRYKAFYSLDCNDGIENAAIGWAQPSPEDCLMEKEAQAEYAELLRRLYEAISSLTPNAGPPRPCPIYAGDESKGHCRDGGYHPHPRLGSPSMRRSGGCAGTSYAGNGQAAYENHQPEKILLPDLQEGHFLWKCRRVADAIVEESRAENANDAKQHYHCYSLDASPGMENHFPEQAVSPEDILMEKETEREQEAAPRPDDGTAPGGPLPP